MRSVDAYLDNTETISSDTAREIRSVIEDNPFIKDMVRVPIHLDILCYSWGELHGQNAPTELTTDEGEHFSPTITALYQAVVRSLWRKDIPSLGKLDHGEPIADEVVNAVRDSARLERPVQIESNFLEEIANKMMESDRLEFIDKDIAEAIERSESNGNPLPLSLERNLHKLSLLRSYPTEGHQKYSFVHLTFQEFFAARYLARQVARDRASFEAILRQHKYNRRYQIVWMFFTGLLSKVKELDSFFKLLDEEPRDLVGLQHIHLIMSCLSECQIQTRLGHWDEYQARLEDWFQLENYIAKDGGISSSMAFPENILRNQLLKAESTSSRSTALLLLRIRGRNSLSESSIKDINQLMANDHDNYLINSVMPFSHTSESPEFIDTVKRNFTTIRFPKQKGKLRQTDISFFMKQIQSKTAQQFDAYFILKQQRHLPDVAIKELVEWLKDPYLSYYADGILGNQANLPKETIDSAIETLDSDIEKLLDQRSFGSWSHLYTLFVVLRQDLHAEAIAKVWDCLENAALRNVRIPDGILLEVSRTYPLQPVHVERLVKLLEIRLCPECIGLKNFAIKVLEQQPSLPTNVLKRIMKLLRDEHSELFRAAQQILQKQPALHDDIIDKLRDLFKNDKGKVAAVLKERLHLPTKTMKWLVAQTTEAKDADIRCREAVDYLLGQSDLPNYLVNALPELIEDEDDFSLVAELLGQQRAPSDEVVNRLLRLIPFRTEITALRVPEIIKKDAFAEPLIEALEQSRSKIKAKNVGHLLRNTNLDQASVRRLRSLMDRKRDKQLAKKRSDIASKCLFQQVKLDRETISDLHDDIRNRNLTYPATFQKQIKWLWGRRHMEQFCANVAEFHSEIIHHILKVFLRRSVEDLAPAYINGNTLYFYAADGKLTEQRLEDEQAFREKFREAQRMLKVPEWAMVKLREGRRGEDPCSTSYSAIPRKRSAGEAASMEPRGGLDGRMRGHTGPPSRRGRRA